MFKIDPVITISAVLGAGFLFGVVATEPGARMIEAIQDLSAPSEEHAEPRAAYPAAETDEDFLFARDAVQTLIDAEVDPRLSDTSYNLVIAPLDDWEAAGMVDWRVSPNTLYVAPQTGVGEAAGLRWIATHELAHVKQFEVYDVAGTTWLDQQRLKRLSSDAHAVFPDAEDETDAVEMLADCMAMSALDRDPEDHPGTAYLDDASVCADPEVSDAVETVLHGKPLSTVWWQ